MREVMLSMKRRKKRVREVRTDCGIIVMFERSASRLSELVGMPSYRTSPSVGRQRSRDSVRVLCSGVVSDAIVGSRVIC